MSHYSLSLKTVCLCGKCDVCECLCDHSCDLKIDFCNMGNIQAIATPELFRLDKQCQSKLPLYFTNECLCPSFITSTDVGVRTTTAQRIISWKLCDDVKGTVYCNATLKFWHSFAALLFLIAAGICFLEAVNQNNLNFLMNILEQFANKDPDISLSRRAGLISIFRLQTQKETISLF